MKLEKPANREGFNRQRERLTSEHPIHRIDTLFAFQLEIGLAHYHGGYVRAGWHMLKHGVRSTFNGFYWNAVFRFCDKIGWTRLQLIPGSDYFERHSAKCDRMNCADMNCVQSGIPKWFAKLTRMPDRE